MTTFGLRDAMTTDTIHTITGCTSLLLIAAGAWVAFGIGYALMTVGGILLAGTIYARTR